jgi:hypothetical protein
MVTATDFTPQEWELLCKAPLMVASTSMMIGPVSMLKAMTHAFTLILILHDTSKHFPENRCIQEIIVTLRKPKDDAQRMGWDDRPNKHTIDGQPLRGKEAAVLERNAWSDKAISILRQKSHPQELNEYKQWLLLIASQVMEKVKSYGFLGLRKDTAELELSQAIHNFALVLQVFNE